MLPLMFTQVVNFIYMNSQILYKRATETHSTVARKSANGIPDRGRLSLYCWLEPPSLRSATGAKRINYFPTASSHFTWQSQFEAITIVAFTGVHIFGLLAVIYWFFLESEQKYIAAKWLLHPFQQYNRDLELQRDIWW